LGAEGSGKSDQQGNSQDRTVSHSVSDCGLHTARADARGCEPNLS
jgi:hypothetical protein